MCLSCVSCVFLPSTQTTLAESWMVTTLVQSVLFPNIVALVLVSFVDGSQTALGSIKNYRLVAHL
jgi:hypothetical protein